MSLADDELTIREFLGVNRITPEMPVGSRVIPAPIYFEDNRDYWATIESVSYENQYELETTHIFFCSLYFLNFVDIEGPKHSPLIGINYEIYLFSQYDLQRGDENLSADEFLKKTLNFHNKFVKCVFDIKEAFQGEISMGLLDTNIWAKQYTTPLVQNQFVTNKGACEFIPNVNGHFAKFQEQVRVKKIAC